MTDTTNKSALSQGDLTALAGNPSALNAYGANQSDIDSYNSALQDSVQALKDRYAQPNWFNVAAGLAKPQLGGFTASMGSAAQALGDWQEQQRAQQLPIAQMQQQLALNKITMGQNKSAAEKLKSMVSGQTPINPVTVADTVATAPGAATAEAAKNMLPSISTATGNILAGQNVLPVNGAVPNITGAGTVPQPIKDAMTRNANADATGQSHKAEDDAFIAGNIGGTKTENMPTDSHGFPVITPAQQAGQNSERLRILQEELKTETNPDAKAALQREIASTQGGIPQNATQVTQPAAQPGQQNSTLSPAQQAGLTQTAAITREAGYSDLHKQNALPFTDDKMQLISNAITPLAKILKLPETAQSLGVLNGMAPGVKAAAAVTANGGAKASLQTPFGGLGGALTVPVVDIMNATNLTPEQRTNLLTIRNGIAQVKSLMGNSDASAGLMRDVSEANSVDDVRRVLANAYATASQGNLVQKAKQKYDSHTNGLYTGFQDSQERQDALEKAKDNFLRAAKIGMPK